MIAQRKPLYLWTDNNEGRSVCVGRIIGWMQHDFADARTPEFCPIVTQVNNKRNKSFDSFGDGGFAVVIDTSHGGYWTERNPLAVGE